MLAYQFVAGLVPALRLKVAGVEGNFDQLLVKARFEEEKLRDLAPAHGNTSQEHNITSQDASSTMQPTEGRKALYSMGGGRLSRTVPAGRLNSTGSRPVT